jgi:hypothetical protein
MWIGLVMWGSPAASNRRRTEATTARRCWRSLAPAFRCRILASAAAATDGGSALMKMKPDEKLRTKSHSAVLPVIQPPTTHEPLGQRRLDSITVRRWLSPSRSAMPPLHWP